MWRQVTDNPTEESLSTANPEMSIMTSENAALILFVLSDDLTQYSPSHLNESLGNHIVQELPLLFSQHTWKKKQKKNSTNIRTA